MGFKFYEAWVIRVLYRVHRAHALDFGQNGPTSGFRVDLVGTGFLGPKVLA